MADAGPAALFDFGFKSFITLSVIKILYILGMVFIALAWLVAVAGAFMSNFLQGLAALVLGAIVALIYLIMFRIWLELIVVLFRIGENTTKLVEMGGGTPAGTEMGAT